MNKTDVVIIGGGQAGLAMSYCLTARGIDHVVLERGRVAERWRSERWDSLRLLTPNWQSRLPGFRYTGAEPDGFMSRTDVVGFLERYAASFSPAIETGVDVERVAPASAGYRVTTSQGIWHAAVVVIATGYCQRTAIPSMAARLSSAVLQLGADAYRNPAQLPDGAVLVVGASASGVQLADEIQASGRPVTIAVGRHTRLPRRYRGFDILWWMDRMGLLAARVDDVFDTAISKRQPSMQLSGRLDRPAMGLAELDASGVRVMGRLVDLDDRMATFDDDLIATTAAADLKLAALLGRVDEYIEAAGLARVVPAAEPFVPSWPRFAGAPQRLGLDLGAAGVRAVIWATGFSRDYSWLNVPVLDAAGEIVTEQGITPAPGLFVIGLPFLRKRNSAFIDGVGGDAAVLAGHAAAHLSHQRDSPVPCASAF